MADGSPTPDRRPPLLARAALACQQWLNLKIGLARLDPGRLLHLTFAFAIGIAAGLAFIWARLPLPWLLGPLSVALVLAMWGRPLAQPHALLQPVRALLGVAVGASFSPDLVAKLWGTALSLVLMVPYMAAITLASTLFLVRVARFDRATAFFCSAPGGLGDIIFFAQDAGAEMRRVTLIQAARVVAIVFALPFWLQFGGGLPLGGAMPKNLHVWELRLLDAAVILVLAWAGWRLALRLGLLGGAVIGPMLLSGLVHIVGLTEAKVPVEGLILTQLTIGLVIGGNFKGITLRELVTILSWGVAIALMLVAAAMTMATATSALTGLDRTALLLSYAPGGQNEMAIMALILGIDVAIVALHHLVRVVLVVGGAQLVMRSNADWHRKERP